MTSEPPKKALHEYRREATQEELDQVARYLAEGRTKTYMAEQMGQTFDRISRLVKRVDVMNAAIRLRETQVIPDAILNLEKHLGALLPAVLDMTRRLTDLEVTTGRLSKAMALKRVQATRDKASMKSLRKENRELRNAIRKRGIVV